MQPVHRRILQHAPLALKVALAAALLAPAPAGAVGPTAIPRVDDLIDAPRALFGTTRAAVERTLGQPPSVQSRPLPHLLDPAVMETAQELAYPGALISVTPSGALRRVEITTAAWRLPHGLGVGATRRHVEAMLGEPQEMTDGRYLYLYSDGYPRTVELYFREERVYRLEWNYWAE
jgi:hypothetical protein